MYEKIKDIFFPLGIFFTLDALGVIGYLQNSVFI